MFEQAHSRTNQIRMKKSEDWPETIDSKLLGILNRLSFFSPYSLAILSFHLCSTQKDQTLELIVRMQNLLEFSQIDRRY